MIAAPSPAPIEPYRLLRPNRSPIPSWPATAQLIAAIAGDSTAPIAACTTIASRMGGPRGVIAKTSGTTPVTATAAYSTARRRRPIRSMNKPAGTWDTMLATVPAVSTTPICVWVQA